MTNTGDNKSIEEKSIVVFESLSGDLAEMKLILLSNEWFDCISIVLATKYRHVYHGSIHKVRILCKNSFMVHGHCLLQRGATCVALVYIFVR